MWSLWTESWAMGVGARHDNNPGQITNREVTEKASGRRAGGQMSAILHVTYFIHPIPILWE